LNCEHFNSGLTWHESRTRRRVDVGGAVSDETLRQEIIERFDQAERRLDRAMETATEEFIEQRSYTEFAHDRLDKALNALSCGITRLERKLDRLLALIVESRGRSR
jgi:hypothetical protein